MKLPEDCTIRLVDLPVDCGGMVSMSPDGHYNIYLNARLDHYARREKLSHEIAHIEHNDFFNTDDIRTVEARADGLPAHLKPIPHLMRASDLLSHSKSLPPMGKVAAPSALTDEVPRSPVPVSPRQAAVIVHAINDLDDWLFRDTTFEL